jgi:hypothetical protein
VPVGAGYASKDCLIRPCLVFIDETAVSTSMTRPDGRALRGERVIGRVPFGTWKTFTFVAAPRCDRMTAPMMINGAMNGAISGPI